MVPNDSSDFHLIIRQQPERARVAGDKEKARKPIDPPPIVQLQVKEQNSYLAQHYLQSPYYILCCSVCHATEDLPAPVGSSSTALAGTSVSSLHHLKDLDNTDGGFFVFGDLSIRISGEFRLKFTLFEIQNDSIVTNLKSIISEPFTVSLPKSFPGMAESTLLSKSFADQGVKLRLRKQPRTSINRVNPQPEDLQLLGSTFGDYSGMVQNIPNAIIRGPVDHQYMPNAQGARYPNQVDMYHAAILQSYNY
ncbi:hypothetical protein ASPZODRAFT_14462 [Penicilliopsis zonata CBS 506.65]|uniref:Velvet domain-containing protein n=1 Tax=Penicilliopsis zonata CBS 506.65 TaxID=1073090 RepID=A0A1L9SMB3_9EURO|nr:hypothetical protein ASPZODRAFT_14462 [Penicilliopsis zonata CBS 506.65]OJJ48318.1 hypothetical protein ASPZODRAFT_14462 [Penicilliopsis zonata CBS 506.65]